MITKNLPWFLREPAIALVGEKCYRSIVEELNVSDVQCIKYGLSKGLSLGIIVGSSIVKVPQAVIILRARSARGLSLSSYVLETFSYAITFGYNFRNGFPFSTYGENLFLTLQNILINVLIVYYPSSPPGFRTPRTAANASYNPTGALLTLLATLAAAYALYIIPPSILSLLQIATLPLSVVSKLPQITANHRARSTGQLSAIAVGSQIVGCLARVFTNATEVGDHVLFLGFALALVLNCVVGLQMWMYWDADREATPAATAAVAKDVKVDGEKYQLQGRVDIVVPPKAPSPGPGHTAMPTGRRWARKVD